MHYKSKTLATWLAIVGGLLGLHRFYLHGLRDVWGWLHPVPSALGLIGVLHLRSYGQDDRLGWLLAPVFGAMLAVAMATAIFYALTPDERWDARHNPDHPSQRTAWGPVLGAVLAMLLGGAALMSSIAYAGQKFFEWQMDSEA
jgi:TM2 domain-containing membrane protein YozV